MQKKLDFFRQILYDNQADLRILLPHGEKEYDPLAQSVEHLTFNQGVRSSNLRWITKIDRYRKMSVDFILPSSDAPHLLPRAKAATGFSSRRGCHGVTEVKSCGLMLFSVRHCVGRHALMPPIIQKFLFRQKLTPPSSAQSAESTSPKAEAICASRFHCG